MSLLFNKEDILLVNRRLAALIGLNEAIVLQQIHYWLQRKRAGGVEHDGRRWVFNTLESWREQFPFWSKDTVKRALAALKKSGLLLVKKLAEASRDQTNYYSIDYQQIALLEASNLPSSMGANCTDGKVQPAPPTSGQLAPMEGANCTDDYIEAKTTTETTSPAAALPGAKKVAAEEVSEEETAFQAACRATWRAYSVAYQARYKTPPVRNQAVSSKVKQFVKRIGYAESPEVAAFFVNAVNESFVVRKIHDFGLLLASAEGYRTQWFNGAAITSTRAKQVDQSQANYDTAGEAMTILRQRRAEANAC